MPQKPNTTTPSEESVATPTKSPEEIKEALREQELLHLNLGYIAGLFSNSKYYVKTSIGHFMASVIPALRFNQFKIFFNGFRPVAYASWALLSDEIQEKYKNGNYPLVMNDWKSGENLWLVEFIAPYSQKDRDAVIKNLQEKIFVNKTINIITRNEDGSLKAVIQNFK